MSILLFSLHSLVTPDEGTSLLSCFGGSCSELAAGCGCSVLLSGRPSLSDRARSRLDSSVEGLRTRPRMLSILGGSPPSAISNEVYTSLHILHNHISLCNELLSLTGLRGLLLVWRIPTALPRLLLATRDKGLEPTITGIFTGIVSII